MQWVDISIHSINDQHARTTGENTLVYTVGNDEIP